MSNTPKQPDDPPEGGASPSGSPGHGQHGIAEGQHEHNAAGLPNDDRHDTETAPSRIESGSESGSKD